MLSLGIQRDSFLPIVLDVTKEALPPPRPAWLDVLAMPMLA